MNSPITVPVYLLVSLMGLNVAIIYITITMTLKGKLVPERYYNEAVERGNAERHAKEEAVAITKDTLELNKRLAAKDDVAIQFVESLRKDALWVRQQQEQFGGSPEGSG